MPKATRPQAIFGMLDGYRPITNLLGAGDPDVHRIDDQWWMFFGGFQRNFRNNLFSASLPRGAHLSEGAKWTMTTAPAHPNTALPLVDQPVKGAWDHYGLHEPCFVSGPAPESAGEQIPCRRIYYTGRASRQVLGNKAPYAIGVLEWTPEGWKRCPRPVVVGDTHAPSALGPKVVYADGKWRMWFRATPREPARGDHPVHEIRYTESEDGINGWSQPRPFRSSTEGFAHAYVLNSGARSEMLLSKSPNLYGEPHYPPQKLWLSTSTTPSGDVRDWSAPEEVLDAAKGDTWMRNGLFGSSLCVDDAPGTADIRRVFCTGVHESISWPKYALGRLAAFRRPPVPAPYYFTIGHFTLDLDHIRRASPAQSH